VTTQTFNNHPLKDDTLQSVSATLALVCLEGVGNRRILGLVREFGSAFAAINADRKLLQSHGLSASNLRRLDAYLANPQGSDIGVAIGKVLAQSDREQVQLLTLDMPDYPPLLMEIIDPPAILYVKGRVELLHLPQIAIVGSRNASLGANSNAFNLARALCDAGFVVTSGFALGIDKSAHEGALAAKVSKGQTVAVMGTGIDRCYPARNQALLSAIVENAVALSELPFGTGPLRHNFPSRNRIISGLSLGVLVIEAGLQSGSLITARMAMEQGREVFAIPGSIHHPLAKGCHQLIRQGAKLTETVDDILEELEGALQFHYAVFNQQSAIKLSQQGLSMAPARSGILQGALDLSDSPHFDTQSTVSLIPRSPTSQPLTSQPLTSHLPTAEPAQAPLFGLTTQGGELLSLIGSDTVSVDTLIDATGLAAPQILEGLFDLEMQGLVESVSGGYRRIA
jgi:DNA processing protein